MKRSSGGGARRRAREKVAAASPRTSAPPARSRLEPLLALLVALTAGIGVAALRPGLAQRFHQLSTRSDVYALPTPQQTVALSLGWRSALADLLFANVRVSYGLHLQEKRRFEFVGNYLDTINALDPKFRTPYQYADTLLTLGSEASPLAGLRQSARSSGAGAWPSFPTTASCGRCRVNSSPTWRRPPPRTRRSSGEWRLEGARRLARACELIGDNKSLPYHCITAAQAVLQ